MSENRNGGEVIAALKIWASKQDQLNAIIIAGDTDPRRIREAASHGATLLQKPVVIYSMRGTIENFFTTNEVKQASVRSELLAI